MKYRFSRRFLFVCLIFFNAVFSLLPYIVAKEVGKGLGYLGYILFGRYRRLSKGHLRIAFGGLKSEKEISKLTRQMFMNLGMTAAEIMILPKLKNRLDKIVEVKGIEKVDEVLKEKKGAIVISGHFGNWELLGPYFAYRGYPSNIVVRPIYYDKYNNWLISLRSQMGINVISRIDYPKKILRVLKDNELVGFLSDQDIDSIDGVFVDFFGIKAYTPSAPVKFALSTGAPIIPMLIVRGRNKHTIFVEEPIRVEGEEDKKKATLLYTQRYTKILEDYIRSYPDHWVWLHRRWKTRPAGNDQTVFVGR